MLGLATGLTAATAQALPPNACTRTNTDTGGSSTSCGPCGEAEDNITQSAVHVASCSAGGVGLPNNKTTKKAKKQPKAPPSGN